MDTSTKKQAGIKMREVRESSGLTQRELAEKLGMKQQQYSRFENGENEMNYDQIKSFCRFFDLSSDYLLGLEEY